MVKAKDKKEAEAIVRFGEWDRQIGVVRTETYLDWETEKEIPPGQEKLEKDVDAFS